MELPKQKPNEKKQATQPNDGLNSTIGQLTRQHRQAQARNKAANENDNAYYKQTEGGITTPILSFKLRTGRTFFFHYAYRFNVDMPSYNTLVIMAHSAQIEISIEGKNLDLLIPYLLAAQVEWIRESENPMMNDAGEGVFISAIKLEGKAFE